MSGCQNETYPALGSSQIYSFNPIPISGDTNRIFADSTIQLSLTVAINTAGLGLHGASDNSAASSAYLMTDTFHLTASDGVFPNGTNQTDVVTNGANTGIVYWRAGRTPGRVYFFAALKNFSQYPAIEKSVVLQPSYPDSFSIAADTLIVDTVHKPHIINLTANFYKAGNSKISVNIPFSYTANQLPSLVAVGNFPSGPNLVTNASNTVVTQYNPMDGFYNPLAGPISIYATMPGAPQPLSNTLLIQYR